MARNQTSSCYLMDEKKRIKTHVRATLGRMHRYVVEKFDTAEKSVVISWDNTGCASLHT